MKNELKSSTTTTATKAERSNTQVFKFVSFVSLHLSTFDIFTQRQNKKNKNASNFGSCQKKVFKTLSDPFSVKLRQKFCF